MLAMVATAALWPAGRRHGEEAQSGRGEDWQQPEAEPAAADELQAQPQPPHDGTQAGEAPPELQGARGSLMDDSEAEYDIAEEATALEESLLDEQGWDHAWGDDPVTAAVLDELQDQSEVFSSSGRYSSSLCPRCGLKEESSFHQLWECRANEEIPGVKLELLLGAREHHQEAPCFWLRGLPPLWWTYPHCTRPVRGQPNFTGCSPQEQFQVEPAMVLAATDGSGGLHSADPRVRRCG